MRRPRALPRFLLAAAVIGGCGAPHGPRVVASHPPPSSARPPAGWITEAPALDRWLEGRPLDRFGETLREPTEGPLTRCLEAALHAPADDSLTDELELALTQMGCAIDTAPQLFGRCGGFTATLSPQVEEGASELRFFSVCVPSPELRLRPWLRAVELSHEVDWLIDAAGLPESASLELGPGRSVVLSLMYRDLPARIDERLRRWAAACDRAGACPRGARRRVLVQPATRVVEVLRVGP